MADWMSFDKYIDNPSGKATVVTNRKAIKEMYKSKFDKILLRESGRINYTIYRSKDKNDSYYIHIKVPSEVIEEFYYDVVIQLYTTENKKKLNANLREYAVKFYSNDPAFVYTFAHSFAANNLFIKDLQQKMSTTALKKPALIKNPKDDVWYVKSLFFAYLTMEKYNLFSRSMLDRNSISYSKRTLLSKITHASEKVEARQNAQAKLAAANKESKTKVQQRNVGVQAKHSSSSNIVKTATTTRTSRKSNRVKTTKKISMNKKS